MINFNSLQLVVHDTYSFVGIKKENDNLVFCLPKGFENGTSNLNTFSGKSKTFFLFYKILNVFKDICIDKGYLDESCKLSTQDRDGVIKSKKGSLIEQGEEDSENIFYSKLDIIGHLLNAYDEPKILALAYRLGKSDKINLNKIHQYLHQVVYLPNHAVYVDEMLLPKQTVQFESTSIVTMYCYLYCEIKRQLDEDVNGEITALGERFRQHYLGAEDSLFDELSYEQVLDTLKDALQVVDHNTVIKDADYWQYYDAIELFLYGDWQQRQEGEIWGIKNFHSVWESMSLTYLVNTTSPSYLLQVDTQFLSAKSISKVNSSKKAIDLTGIFTMNGKTLIPDAVKLVPISEQLTASNAYALSSYNWNDYNYYTRFSEGKKSVHIAYQGQETGSENHTFEKLKEIFKVNGSGRIVIDSRLPENYYSYWKISNDPSDIDLHKMFYLNHFFFIGLEKGIANWEQFKKFIFEPLNIFAGYNSNVFITSLFRDYPESMVEENFEQFMALVPSQFRTYIQIIDIKYFHSSYFQNKKNTEEIKNRSVRKQFVYEYLLQKELELRRTAYITSPILSNFWLPDYRPDDPDLFLDSASFIDGFIQLIEVNFMELTKNYI